jgi:lipopolysaccharide/colanic/teichoic acid biosynthesis glycosyltransferase
MPEHRHLGELLSPSQTAASVRRERARADRIGGRFALAVFHLDHAGWRNRSLMRLARMVLQCVRHTDEVGRYDARSICAILPDTGSAGALRLVRRVEKLAASGWRKLRPVSVIYTYPDEQNDGDGDGDAETAPDHSSANDAADNLPDVSETEHAAARTMVLPLSDLLAKPSPWWKRAVDISAASLGILVAGIPMLLIALAIKLTSPGPIMFRQKRAGLGGRPFSIYKFRTMVVDAEAQKAALRVISEQDGPAFKLKHDPRITPIGGFLRSTSLDELPQLFNVLKGDMSLVGPRPLPVDESDACDQWHRRRLDVAPGLTCIWQIEGRSRVSFEQWMRMDMAYMRSRRLLGDVALLLRTIPAVLLRKGAS